MNLMASAVQSALQTSEWPSIIINVLTNLTSYSGQAISHTGCGKKLLNWVISKLSQTWHKAVAWQLGFGLLRPQARPKPWAGRDFGWAWPGLFWPSLAWLLAWGRAMHITSPHLCSNILFCLLWPTLFFRKSQFDRSWCQANDYLSVLD